MGEKSGLEGLKSVNDALETDKSVMGKEKSLGGSRRLGV
jgi:hypothetical protein